MCNVENIGLLSKIAKFTAVELYNVARYVVDSENVTHIFLYQQATANIRECRVHNYFLQKYWHRVPQK